ncbi:Protein of unknown function [Cotesia congregata]|uniref:Uncharacterized protein n=1 Tax=Cotesia congregata TaxID=51543 RepID=A0A8J2HCF2_COTCN|nr:Protein of unknown function [Cotesia congregata]
MFRTKCVLTKLRKTLTKDLTYSQKEFIDELLGIKSRLKYQQVIDNVKLLGEPDVHKLTQEQYLAFQRRHIFLDRKVVVQHYDRAVVNRQVLHSNRYEKCQKRNNRCVRLINNEVFQIESFIVFELNDETHCYAIGWYFQKCQQPIIAGRRLKHMLMVERGINCLGVAYPSEIIERVTILPIENSSNYVACIHPNRFDMFQNKKIRYQFNSRHFRRHLFDH